MILPDPYSLLRHRDSTKLEGTSLQWKLKIGSFLKYVRIFNEMSLYLTNTKIVGATETNIEI